MCKSKRYDLKNKSTVLERTFECYMLLGEETRIEIDVIIDTMVKNGGKNLSGKNSVTPAAVFEILGALLMTGCNPLAGTASGETG